MRNRAAPSDPHINATVMASAGTGKTYMLVNRLVRLLLAGACPDAILAITFTRKAAAEMQSRLAERLFALAAAPADELDRLLERIGVDADAATHERARCLYEDLLRSRQPVRTTTFHAFCQEILLRFPLEADVPPGFELLDSAGELLQTARETLLAEAGNHPDGELASALQRLLDYCGGLHGLERALASFIAHRGDWWAYTEGQADPVDFARNELAEQLDTSAQADPLQAFFSTERLGALAEFAELLSRHPNKGNNTALEALADARNPEQPTEQRFAAARRAFLTQNDEPRKRKASKAQAQKMGEDGEARFLELHLSLSQAVLKTLEQLNAQAAWQAGSDWYLTGNRLLQHYQQLKREQRLLDFTDLEWRAYRLLNHSDNALWVQYKLDQRIDHLLVDEFQDTNPTQWRLLLPLLQEMAAGSGEKLRSVFLVGDAKQSIYRFRRAEPRLFETAHQWLSEQLAAESFPLHTSWRSAPAVMECINQLFGDSAPLGGSLRNFGPHSTHHTGLWGRVEVMPLIEANDDGEAETIATTALRNPLEQPRQLPVDDRYRREGAQIAATIRQLIDSGTPVGSGETARRIGYGDIMILLRKRTHSSYYEEALRDASIPYTGAERGTLLQSLEVGDMVALLEVLITPYNNLSLATVLRSPIFDCDEEELIRLARSGSGGWYQRLQTLALDAEPDSRLQFAARMMAQWRSLAGILPIHDLLDRIFHEANILERYQAAYPPHLAPRAVANLTRFLELALEIDSGRYPSLGHFLARLAEMRDSSDEAPDEAPASGSGETVRILTIHASKGLEAPVVFLADAAQGDAADKAYRALLEWPPEAPRPSRFLLLGKREQQTETVRQQLEREYAEQNRESANLLYVALTRARQLLYVSGVKPGRGDATGWYGAVREALDPQAAVPTEHPCILETGTPPAVSSENEAISPQTYTIDPALTRALTIPTVRREIAPSYRTQHQAAIAGDEDGRIRGIVIHRLLQRMSESDPKQWPSIARSVAAEFAIEPKTTEYRQWFDECQSLLQQPTLSKVFQPAAGVETMNEVPILYSHEQRTVYGIVDRLLLSEDEVWVIDYKSHRHADSGNYAQLAAAYREQLSYYAEGVQRLWPQKRVRSFLLFTAACLLFDIESGATGAPASA